MLQELYLVNDSGQMEMNFEALELLTSATFSHFVKHDVLNLNYKVYQCLDHEDVLIIRLVNSIGMVKTRTFYKEFNKTSFSILSYRDLLKMLEASEGARNGK